MGMNQQHSTPAQPRKKTVRFVIILLLCLGLVPFLGFCYMALGGIAVGLGERGLEHELRVAVPYEFLLRPTRMPQWSPDSSSIVFDHSDGKIYVVGSDGSHLRSISERLGKYDVDYAPDISPDGALIAYATFRHEAGFLWNSKNNIEIVTSRLDGSHKRRLTKNKAEDTYPAWSPDGRSIAFLSDRSRVRFHIYLMDHDGTQQRPLVSSLAVGGAPPVWSPDGSMIAFRTAEGFKEIGGEIRHLADLYTVMADGSNLTRIAGSTMTGPVWSPDSRRIAFVGLDQGTHYGKLSTVAPDGSASRELVLIEGDDLDSNISWSPDGLQILVGSLIVDIDGSVGHRLPDISNVLRQMIENADVVVGNYRLSEVPITNMSTWSPDGSMIAINSIANPEQIMVLRDDYDDSGYDRNSFNKEYLTLHSMFHDGSNRRSLVIQNEDRSLSAGNGRLVDDWQPSTTVYFDDSGRPLPAPLDITQCSNGIVIPNPGANPGLVRDCKTLLLIRDSLGARIPLNWSTDISISEWEGIQRFNASGVFSIHLAGRYLYGGISSEFSKLSALDNLNLNDNRLHGEIPPELGNLSNLDTLDLGSNELEGEIPPELGNLSNLSTLDLGSNELEGEIPPELGNLQKLQVLSFDHDRLTGMLEVLPTILNLGWLRLEGSRCIPKKVFEMEIMEIAVFDDDHVGPCED